METNSAIEYFPLGFKSARTGVFFPILSKSFRESFILASFAMARRCNTALVEPPRAMTIVIAFSSDFFVTISLGFRSFLIQFISALAAFLVSVDFDFETAVCAELLVKDKPIASIAHAIVFAVYMPPHDPGPGIAFFSICINSLSFISPFAFLPTASKTETISIFLFRCIPGSIVPPYTNTDGRFSLSIAMTHAGIFLSHPPKLIKPSRPSPATTASIESEIISLETNEYLIPSDPIDMPSEIVIVLKFTAFPPLESIALLATLARSLMCILHGVTILHVEAIPTCGFKKSLSLKPTALSIDLLGALSLPSTSFEEYFLIFYCTSLPNISYLQPFINLAVLLVLVNISKSLLVAIIVESILNSSDT